MLIFNIIFIPKIETPDLDSRQISKDIVQNMIVIIMKLITT